MAAGTHEWQIVLKKYKNLYREDRIIQYTLNHSTTEGKKLNNINIQKSSVTWCKSRQRHTYILKPKQPELNLISVAFTP